MSDQDLLTEETITFGKYKGLDLPRLLRDRKYCRWLVQESWFQEKYEFLYNRVKEYNPRSLFIRSPILQVKQSTSALDFCERFEYFNLIDPSTLTTELTNIQDYKCYEYYFSIMVSIKDQILKNIEACIPQPLNVTTPNKWLQKFEIGTNLSRDVFKEFIEAHDLLNVTSVIERIKKEVDIEYNGAKSFIIAKKNSIAQEAFWEARLKQKYSEDIGVQFKFENCIFDFIHINSNTIYECKLSFKDFDQKQFNKYSRTLDRFNIVYLIGYDTIIRFDTNFIYSTLSDVNFVDASEDFRNIILNFQFFSLGQTGQLMNYL